MQEKWSDIKKYENIYQVSDKGNIKSFCLYKGTRVRILKPYTQYDGYKSVKLHKDKKGTDYKVARLVALAFIPNPFNKPCVNHINGIKTDNRVDNLEWCTHKENMQHAVLTGLHSKNIKKVNMIKDNIIVEQFNSQQEAERKTTISQASISLCCRGLRKTAGGYIWEYKEEQND